MYQVCAVKDYGAGSLTMRDIDEGKRVIDSQKVDLLMVELVDIFKVEDLEMDLADKKIYQIINKTNNAKYYYDQVKYQCG